MAEEEAELLFFDTFAHDVQEQLNLDLVQFPQAVLITEIRIIPLGARVQSDSSSFIRLGATNPSKFHVDFFVNDLRKPASTFECLGSFDYNQNDCIHLSCVPESGRKIATDGLVLKGCYTTITLAVYGYVTTNIVDAYVEDEISPPEDAVADENEIWPEDNVAVEPSKVFVETETAFYSDGDIPKDPRRRRTRSSSFDKDLVVIEGGKEGRRVRREWSRSPDYRARPRSPSDASRRPRSPSLNSNEEEFPVAKSPARLPEVSKSITVRSPTPSTPVEHVDEDIDSPIRDELEDISEDEIAGDAEWDLDYEPGYFEVINTFNPFEPLKQYQVETEDGQQTQAAQMVQKQAFEDLKKSLERFNAKAAITHAQFLTETPDNKDLWVHYAEQAVQQLVTFNGTDHSKNDRIVAAFVKSREPELQILTEYIMIGLEFDYAVSQPQPAYKIRHMKAGIRLVEVTCCYEPLAEHVLYEAKFNIFEKLFSMYFQEFMALSIRLMIFKTIYAVLDSSSGVNYFLGDNNEFNGYQTLIELLQSHPTGRTMVAVKSLIKKLNLFEAFSIVKTATAKIFEQIESADAKINQTDWELLIDAVLEVQQVFSDPFSLAQPKRFLPATAQFEIPKDAFAVPFSMNTLKAYMKANGFLETLLLVVAARAKVPPTLLTAAYSLLEYLLQSPFGLTYLIDNIQHTNLLVRELFGLPQNVSDSDLELDPMLIHGSKNRALGMEIAYKVQTIYHLDAIMESRNDSALLMENLQALYSLCFNPGRHFVVETICMDNNMAPLLTSIELEKRNAKDGSPDVKNKSPILIYAVDLLDCCIRNSDNIQYLEEHATTLLNLVKQHDQFEPSVSAILQEMTVYLKPLEMCVPSIDKFKEVGPLIEQMNRSLEFISTFPGDLTMSLRILRYKSIPPYEDSIALDHLELKYRYFLLEFYSADGVATLMNILDKLNSYFQQPSVHTASLITSQGLLLAQLLLPTVQILRRILTFVIQARNTEFKDLTAIEPLLKTYALAHAFPERALAFNDAQRVQDEIIKALLAYTQPRADDGFDTENIHKSLWTLMVGEVIKYTLSNPHCFITGLLVLSELLPLPLPIPAKDQLSEREVGQLITERQMWSAHLHSLSNAFRELIQTTCTSCSPEILIILCRVCLQLSDLAPNMTLLISKSITELIITEPLTEGLASAQHARLFTFLTNLVGYPSVKVSMLSILPGKLMEIVDQILVAKSEDEVHQQTQESIQNILQNLLDSEVSMYSSDNDNSNLEMNLACALPSRDLLLSIALSALGALGTCSRPLQYTLAFRTLLLLTEHDVSLTCLRLAMGKKNQVLKETMSTLLLNAKEAYPEFKGVLCLFMELLRALYHVEKRVEFKNIPLRSLTLTSKQLATALDWPQENIKKKEHPITQLLVFLETTKKSKKKEDATPEAPVEATDEPKPETETPQEEKDTPPEDVEMKDDDRFDENWEDWLQSLMKYLNESGDAAEPLLENTNSQFDNSFDMSFPQAEGIVTQFGSRQVYFISDEANDSLTVAHWLTVPPTEDELPGDRVPCDLSELIQTYLPPETNLSSDCKLLLHLSASPQSNRDRQTAAHCFRTRRVDIDLNTGRPEKRLYVSPLRGRGFSRGNISRGDLFRSRPPNTSRPPSLHVDDFTALETRGAQPTGPTGYNKLGQQGLNLRSRGRGRYLRSFAKPHWARNRFSPSGSYRGSSSSSTHSSLQKQSSDASRGSPHHQSSMHQSSHQSQHGSSHASSSHMSNSGGRPSPRFNPIRGNYRGSPTIRRGRYRYMRNYVSGSR